MANPPKVSPEVSTDDTRWARSITKSRPPTGYLSPRDFSRLVEDPLQTVLDKHRLGLFRAAESGGGRGKRIMYSFEQVEEYKKLKVSLRDPAAQLRFYTVEEAHAGFKALEEGKTIREMVIGLKIHPSRATALRDDYVRAGEGVMLEKKHLDEILALGLSGPTEIRSGEDVVATLRIAAEEARALCKCGRGPKTTCSRCSIERAKTAAQRQAKALAAEADRAEIEKVKAVLEEDVDEGPLPAKVPAGTAAILAKRRAKKAAGPRPAPEDEPGSEAEIADPESVLADAS